MTDEGAGSIGKSMIHGRTRVETTRIIGVRDWETSAFQFINVNDDCEIYIGKNAQFRQYIPKQPEINPKYKST